MTRPRRRAEGTVVHQTGVATDRDRAGTASAWGVCDCGWRGTVVRGENAGSAAADDCDAHLIANCPPGDLPLALRPGSR